MVLQQDCKVVDVNANIAKTFAELSLKYDLSMADTIIAATALLLKVPRISDDTHFKVVREIRTEWI